MKRFNNRQDRYLVLFLLISAFGILYFFSFMALDPDFDAFRWLVMEHNYRWQFGDFYRLVVAARDLENVYFNTQDAVYPPLVVCVFHFLWQMNPIELPFDLHSWRELEHYQFSALLFVMLVSCSLILLVIAIRKILDNYSEIQVYGFSALLLFSAPFFEGVIERGNIALIVLIVLLFAMCFKDSESRVLREAALILIAIAASVKIYPAIFGLLYVREKRWKETFRLVLYGLAFFFIPFAFTGGIDGLLQYIKRMISIANGNRVRWTSIRCFFAASCQYLNLNIDAQIIGSWLEKLFLVCSIALVFIEKKYWKRLLFLGGIMAVYVPNSYRYTSIYMVIPLVFLLKELYQEHTKKTIVNYIYITLFAGIFTIPVWAVNREVDFAIFFPIYLILLVGVIDTVGTFIKERHSGLRGRLSDYREGSTDD